MNYLILVIFVFSLLSCRGGGGTSGGSGPSQSSGLNISPNSNLEQDLGSVADILEEEQNFSYVIEQLPQMDRNPAVKFAQAFSVSTDVFGLFYSQHKINASTWGNLNLFIVDSQGQLSNSESINLSNQVVRIYKRDNDQILWESLSPQVVSLYDLNTQQKSDLFSLASNSSPNRRIKSWVNRQNSFCGQVLNEQTLFYSDMQGNHSEKVVSHNILRYDCYDDFIVWIDSQSNLNYWDGDQVYQSWPLSTWGCSEAKSTFSYRASKMHLICMIPNGSNFIRSYYEIQPTNIYNVTNLPPVSAAPHSTYKFKVDNQTSSEDNTRTAILIKQGNQPWQVHYLELGGQKLNVNMILSGFDSNEIILKTSLGIIKYDHLGNYEHSAFAVDWVNAWSDNGFQYIMDRQGKIYQSNDMFAMNWYQEYLKLGANFLTPYRVHSPSVSFTMNGKTKLVDNTNYYIHTNGQLYLTDVQSLQFQNPTQFTLDGKFDWDVSEGKLFFLRNGTTNNTFQKSLIVFDTQTSSLQTHVLPFTHSGFWKIKYVTDNKLILWIGNSFKIYDLMSNQFIIQKSMALRGEPIVLANKKVLFVSQNKLKLYDVLNDEEEVLWEMNLSWYNQINFIYLFDRYLFLRNTYQDIYKIKLPLSKVVLEN